jgi:hypothetical protein
MKKVFVLAIIVLVSVSCGRQKEKIDKTIENGVEVIRNKLEPFSSRSIPKMPRVEKKVLLDFQSAEITKLGIADIRGFDVDSEGNIYISVFRGDYCIYSFSPDGDFESSFARKGEEPGEMPIAKCLAVNENAEIAVFDSAKQKLVVFSRHGLVLREIPTPPHVTRVIPLAGVDFLISATFPQRGSPFYYWVNLSLYNFKMEEIKRLERLKIPNGPGTSYWLTWKGKIYVGSEERDYEIWIYDQNGNLVSKIKKEYRPIDVPAEIRAPWKRAIEQLKQVSVSAEDVNVPEHWPPFMAFFVDDEGRLYVRTFEEGPAKGEYIHDIFDADGVFIGRIALDLGFDREREYVKAKNGRIYGFSEKEAGYEQFSVYQIGWE